GADVLQWELTTLPDTRLSSPKGASSTGSGAGATAGPGSPAASPATELLMRRGGPAGAAAGAAARRESDPPARPPGPPGGVELKAAGEAVVRAGRRVEATSADFAEALALAGDVPVMGDAYTRPVTIPKAQRETLQQVLERFCQENDYQWGIQDGIVLLRSG